MPQGKKSAIREIFDDELAGRLDYLNARTIAYSVAGQMNILKKIVAEADEKGDSSSNAKEKKNAALRAGIGLWIIGKHEEACQALTPVKSDREGAYFRGLCQVEVGDYDAAVRSFKAAAAAGQDAFACDMALTDALRRGGKREEALAIIRANQKANADEAELHYQMARCLEDTLEYEGAMQELERATELNPQHAGALFKLACWYDLRGHDELAIECYEKAAAIQPTHVNVLLNLGILYEDHGRYDDAAELYQRLLNTYPTHPRARMYHADALGSVSMYYDEATERRRGRTALLLQTPLSDFELSARSRSCLEQMDLRTLGDLARLNEEDITVSKNLGDTSFAELSNLLESKGLHFGMNSGGPSESAPAQKTDATSVLAMPVAELDLSVRSQKCMRTIGVDTVGQLIEKTDKDLLQCQNFGQSSLDEMKSKLEKLGLALKPR